jgi:hypothetical protein
LLLEVNERFGTIAQNVGLHSPGAKFLHDTRCLAARAEINMSNIQERILFFRRSVEVLKIAHRHRGIQDDFSLLLRLAQNLRRL